MVARPPTPAPRAQSALVAAGCALVLGGCDGLFATRIYVPADGLVPSDGGAPPTPGPLLDADVAPTAGRDAALHDAAHDGGLAQPAEEAEPWDSSDLSAPDAGDASAPGEAAAPTAPPPAVCVRLDDDERLQGASGGCPAELCLEPRRGLALRSAQAGFACLDAPTRSYCSADLVALAAERERVAFGAPEEHRTLYVLSGPELELTLELDAAVLGEPSLSGLARHLRSLRGSVAIEAGARLTLDCDAADTQLHSLLEGVLHASALCRVTAYTRTLEVPVYLDTSAPIPQLSSERVCTYSPSAAALPGPIVDADLEAPIVLVR